MAGPAAPEGGVAVGLPPAAAGGNPAGEDAAPEGGMTVGLPPADAGGGAGGVPAGEDAAAGALAVAAPAGDGGGSVSGSEAGGLETIMLQPARSRTASPAASRVARGRGSR